MKRAFTILCLCFPLLSALTFSVMAEPHYIRNIGTPEGLHDLLVNTIHRDSDGIIWLGTGSSVERFDGVRLQHYPLEGDNGPLKRVTTIVGTPSHGLWVGNGYGLWQYNTSNDCFEQVLQGEIAGSVTSAHVDSRGTLWVGTSIGLYAIEWRKASSERANDKWQVRDYSLSTPGSSRGVRAISEDEQGTLWLLSSNGLHAMLPNRQLIYYPGAIPDGGFTCLSARDGQVWLGSVHSGLYAFEWGEANGPEANGRYRHVSQHFGSPISAVQVCGHDSLIVGTDGNGVMMIDTRKNEVLEHWSQVGEGSRRLTSNSVYSLLRDERGVLWIGLYQHGLDYTLWQGNYFHVHSTPMFDSEGIAVRSLCIHGQQRLIGTRQGLYFIDKTAEKFRYYGEKELDAQMVFALTRYNDYYYIGTYGGGLKCLHPTTLSVSAVRLPESIGRQIFCLTEDREGRLWVGTEKGAYCLVGHGDKLTIAERYTSYNSQLPQGYVYHIYFDYQGRGWLCTINGMSLYDSESRYVTTSAFPPSFPSQVAVRQVWQDQDSILYFVPERGKLFAIDATWRSHPAPDTEGTDALFITDDGRGHHLVGTMDGLYYTHNDGTCERFGFADGLPSSIFTLCQPQTDDEGTVWLGNSRGLIWYHPDSVNFPRPERQVVISRVMADYQPLDDIYSALRAGKIVMPRGTSDLTILLTDLSMTDPASLRYQYLLEGYDNDWQDLIGTSEHTWQNLRTGRYRLHLRSMPQSKQDIVMTVVVPITTEMSLAIAVGILALLVLIGINVEIARRYRHYRTEREKEIEALRRSQEVVDNRKYRTTNIPVAELRKLKRRVDELMDEQKLYLEPELKLSDIAAKLGVSPFQLSYLFNQHMHTSFYDYVNNYRVAYFKQCVKQGDAKRYTLDALATRCGYNSRTSFFRNFKKLTGKTPSEFIAQ